MLTSISVYVCGCCSNSLYPDPNMADLDFSEEVMKYLSAVFVKPVTVYGQQFGSRYIILSAIKARLP